MTQSDIMLATERLSRMVAGLTLVNDISVELHKRELVAVVAADAVDRLRSILDLEY